MTTRGRTGRIRRRGTGGRGGGVRYRRFAGLAFVALAAEFLTAMMLAASIAPDYDFGAAAISDLGVVPETALLFNGAVVLAGALNALGGYYFYRVRGERWLFGVFALAGLGAVGVGVFPLDQGDLHGLFALLAFVGFNAQALGTAARLSGAMRTLGAFAGGLGLLFLVVMAAGDAGNEALFGPLGHGGTERMIVYPAMLYTVALGGYLLGSPTAE